MNNIVLAFDCCIVPWLVAYISGILYELFPRIMFAVLVFSVLILLIFCSGPGNIQAFDLQPISNWVWIPLIMGEFMAAWWGVDTGKWIKDKLLNEVRK